MSRNVMIIAGEVSGDMHAARIVEALKQQEPDLVCWGVGGDHLRTQQVEVLYDVNDMAVMGLTEVLKRYGFFKRVFNEMVKQAKVRKPDAVLLVDYPGFNIRLAKRLHNMGITVLYYVCPQVWAWHRSRIPEMARIIDRLMVIFPFEVDVFKDTELQVDFVGHPLVSVVEEGRKDPLLSLPWTAGERVAMLPGSRKHEVLRILPVMLETACTLEEREGSFSFILAAPAEEIRQHIEGVMKRAPRLPANIAVVVGATRQVLRQARAAMVASGTATIETALQGCPMIIVYRTSALTYMLARWLVRGVKHIGMVNIVAARTLCPEFIQGAAKPEIMAEALDELVQDTHARTMMVDGLHHVAQALGTPGSEKRVADLVMEELNRA